MSKPMFKMKVNEEQLRNIFPNNTSYITGECYLVWDKANSITSWFIVECDQIDDSLILKAKPNHNQLELIDGSVINGLSFTISPINPDGSLKNYAISSAPGDKGSVNIQIINRDAFDEEPDQDNND